MKTAINLISLIKSQKRLQVAPSSQGWTLIEMLMAAALTLVVTSTAAAGVITLIHSDNKGRAQSKMANDVNRAVEFISEEIRPAIKVESNASTALANAPNFTLPTGATPILVIARPELPQRIVYYTQASANPWLSPNVIYRWGPPMNSNGDYDSTTVNTPSSWTSQVLIDLIDNTATTPTCPTGWQATSSSSIKGFNACVNSTNNLVQLQVSTLTNDVWEGNLSYNVTTKVFARSITNQASTSTFQVTNNQVTLLQPASLTFRVLGGDITCGAGGPIVPVATKVYLNNSTTPVTWDTSQPLQMPRQASGTTADVESIAGNGSVCSGYSMTVSTKNIPTQQVKALVNGDPVPAITPFANQSTIDYFLRGYIQDGKISLPSNQVIYLFEVGATDTSSSAFDMQDNVVLATINPAD